MDSASNGTRQKTLSTFSRSQLMPRKTDRQTNRHSFIIYIDIDMFYEYNIWKFRSQKLKALKNTNLNISAGNAVITRLETAGKVPRGYDDGIP